MGKNSSMTFGTVGAVALAKL